MNTAFMLSELHGLLQDCHDIARYRNNKQQRCRKSAAISHPDVLSLGSRFMQQTWFQAIWIFLATARNIEVFLWEGGQS